MSGPLIENLSVAVACARRLIRALDSTTKRSESYRDLKLYTPKLNDILNAKSNISFKLTGMS
jgi:hypothetical protein